MSDVPILPPELPGSVPPPPGPDIDPIPDEAPPPPMPGHVPGETPPPAVL